MFPAINDSNALLQKSPFNFIADALWDDFVAGRPIEGGVVFETQLRQCTLNGSLNSLKQLDKFLLYVRGQVKQSSDTFMNQENSRNLLWFVAFYMGKVLAKAWQSTPNWLGRQHLSHYSNLKIDVKNPFELLALDYLPKKYHKTAEYKYLFFALEPIAILVFGDINQQKKSIMGNTISPSVFISVFERLPPPLKKKFADQYTDYKAKHKVLLEKQSYKEAALKQQVKEQEQAQIEDLQAPLVPLTQQPTNQKALVEKAPSAKITKKPKLSKDDAAIISSRHNLPTPKVQLLIQELVKPEELSQATIKKELVVRKDDYSELREELLDIDVPQLHGKEDYAQATKMLIQFDKHIAKGIQAGKATQDIKLSDNLKKARQQALKLLNKSAQLGNTAAMLRLSIYYFLGEGIPKDDAKGFALVKKSADSGDVRGQRQLSRLYYKGVGKPQDIELGRHWLEIAADNGHKEAQALLDEWNTAQTIMDERRSESTTDRRYLILIGIVIIIGIIIAILI